MAAKTYTQLDSTVIVAEQLSALMDEARTLARRLTDHYFAWDFSDCDDTPTPSYVELDALGNLRGHTFAPADFINLVNLAQQYEKFLTGQSPANANYVPIIETATRA